MADEFDSAAEFRHAYDKYNLGLFHNMRALALPISCGGVQVERPIDEDELEEAAESYLRDRLERRPPRYHDMHVRLPGSNYHLAAEDATKDEGGQK